VFVIFLSALLSKTEGKDKYALMGIFILVFYNYYAHMGIKMENKTKRGRPKQHRKVTHLPKVDYFKPRGIPLTELAVSELTIEEIEAIRLVDHKGLEQKQASERMGVSRRTLARELQSARGKIADALLNGKAIQISGGTYLANGEKLLTCVDDGYMWKQTAKEKKTGECPACGSNKIKTKKR